MKTLVCRSCANPDLRPFLSLGTTPLADALVDPALAGEPEDRFPLDVVMCPSCSLVQIGEEVPPQKLFVDNYLYFSSFSQLLLDHSAAHAESLIADRGLGSASLVVEIASNDGYLLRNFVAKGIPVLGIDPAPGQAEAAEVVGVPTLTEFFGIDLARRLTATGPRADVIIANNVMAHVPDLNGFVAGMRELIADDGVITIENPYVRDLVEHVEFDTIYHEHHCYFSCTAVDQLMRRHDLHLNDIEYFPNLHGGTLRWYVEPVERPSTRILEQLAHERDIGLTTYDYYSQFASQVLQVKLDLRALLDRLRSDGSRIAGYGAAAKGATLLNYTGIGADVLDYVVDRNVHKQGLLMPGVRVPILPPEQLLTDRPDYLLLLAWNFADEIMQQQEAYREAGGRFIVPVPTPVIL
jgi:SAM-dependent methyltransferase